MTMIIIYKDKKKMLLIKKITYKHEILFKFIAIIVHYY